MENEVASGLPADSPPILANSVVQSPVSSPFRPRRTPPLIIRPAGSRMSKQTAQTPDRASSPEDNSPFRLHSSPPLLKLPVRRKLFVGGLAATGENLLGKRGPLDAFEPPAPKKVKVAVGTNRAPSPNSAFEDTLSDDLESENSIDFSPRSTTSEAQPPPADAPFKFEFDHAVFRRRGVDLLNGMPLGLCLGPFESSSETRDSEAHGAEKESDD